MSSCRHARPPLSALQAKGEAVLEVWELQDCADRIGLQVPSLQALIDQLNEAGECVWRGRGWQQAVDRTARCSPSLTRQTASSRLHASCAGELLKKGGNRYQVAGASVRLPDAAGGAVSGHSSGGAWGGGGWQGAGRYGGGPSSSQPSAGSKRSFQQSQQSQQQQQQQQQQHWQQPPPGW